QKENDAYGEAPVQEQGTRHQAAEKQAHHDGSDHGGQSLWGQQQTRIVRRQASEHLQVLRQEKGEAEQTDHGDPADQVPDQKVPSLKESYIQQWTGRAKLERNEEQQEQQGQEDGTRHREPRCPAIIGQVGQSKQQQAQATGNEQETSQIKGQGWLKLRLMQHPPADHDPDDANGKVDIKNPAPVHIFSQIAAEHRAKSRGDQDRNAKDAIGQTALFLGKRSKDER